MTVDRITSNHCIHVRGFCVGSRKNLLELIYNPEYVYMFETVTLLDGMLKSVTFQELPQGNKLANESNG